MKPALIPADRKNVKSTAHDHRHDRLLTRRLDICGVQVVWEAAEQLTDSELALLFEMLFPNSVGDLTVCEEELNSSCRQQP
jgi:hypothetical protein